MQNHSDSDKLSLKLLSNFKLRTYIEHFIDKELIGNYANLWFFTLASQDT